MTVLNNSLIDALNDAIKAELLAARQPWKVALPPGDVLFAAPLAGDTHTGAVIETVWGLPVRVDERVPAGCVAIVSDAGAVVTSIDPKEIR